MSRVVAVSTLSCANRWKRMPTDCPIIFGLEKTCSNKAKKGWLYRDQDVGTRLESVYSGTCARRAIDIAIGQMEEKSLNVVINNVDTYQRR